LKLGLADYFGLGLQTVINTLPEASEPDTVDDQQERVMRGGSFFYVPLQARSAYRDKNRVKSRKNYLGFRVVRTLPVPPTTK
jgi:formylglycine-generating enzyme required for sulfatase activity